MDEHLAKKLFIFKRLNNKVNIFIILFITSFQILKTNGHKQQQQQEKIGLGDLEMNNLNEQNNFYFNSSGLGSYGISRSSNSNNNNNYNNITSPYQQNNQFDLTRSSSGDGGGLVDDGNEYRNMIARNYLWRIVPIIFLNLGTIANILSIIVFTRREMRKFSSFCYFAVLNAVNLAVLYVTLVRVIMDYNFGMDIRQQNLFLCKSHVFLTYFLSHLSSLLLCTISIDRVISVMFLREAKDLCTPRVAFMVTIGLIIFNFILSSHFLILESGYVNYTNKSADDADVISKMRTDYLLNSSSSLSSSSASTSSFTTSSSSSRSYPSLNYISLENLNTLQEDIKNKYIIITKIECDSRKNTTYDKFLQNVWKLIDMSIYAFIPFFIMLTCSVIIIIRVAQQSKKFNNNKKSSATNKRHLLVNNGSNKNGTKLLKSDNNNNNESNHQKMNSRSLSLLPATNEVSTKLSNNNNNSNNTNGNNTNSLTANQTSSNRNEMKFSSRTRNLALMLIPVNILFLIFLAPVVIAIYKHKDLGNDQLTLAIVEFLSYCNFTLNFFIYFLTSSKFREEFFKLVDEYFGKCRKTMSNQNVMTNYETGLSTVGGLKCARMSKTKTKIPSSLSSKVLGKTRSKTNKSAESIALEKKDKSTNRLIKYKQIVSKPTQSELNAEQEQQQQQLQSDMPINDDKKLDAV